MRKRVFVGIQISVNFASFLDQWSRNNLKIKNLRLIPLRNLHITLVPPWYEEDIKVVSYKLALIKNNPQSFVIDFRKILPGPNKSRPRLIWVQGQYNNNFEFLENKLHKLLKKELTKRKTIPHITIARFNPNKVNISSMKALKEDISFGETVDNVTLFESKLKRGGAEYSILKKIKLPPSQ
jgi:2'-5' RNA ligase